jgi:phospholipase/lecithinase/hemolysin
VQIPADSLFIVQGGANDFVVNPKGPPAWAVDNIMAGVTLLKEAGAKQILVGNLPDLGKFPVLKASPPGVAQLYSRITAQYNNILEAEVSSFAAANPDITISICDWYSYFSIMMAEPWKYSLKNITDESPNASALNTEADFTSKHYLFWDRMHPTTQAHEAVADFAGKDLKNLAKQKVK